MSKWNLVSKASSSKLANCKQNLKPELDSDGDNKIDNLQVWLSK